MRASVFLLGVHSLLYAKCPAEQAITDERELKWSGLGPASGSFDRTPVRTPLGGLLRLLDENWVVRPTPADSLLECERLVTCRSCVNNDPVGTVSATSSVTGA